MRSDRLVEKTKRAAVVYMFWLQHMTEQEVTKLVIYFELLV